MCTCCNMVSHSVRVTAGLHSSTCPLPLRIGLTIIFYFQYQYDVLHASGISEYMPLITFQMLCHVVSVCRCDV